VAETPPPSETKKRIQRPWVISALSVPMRLIDPGKGVKGLSAFLVLLLFALVTVYYTLPRPKSFFLDVTTGYLEVKTDLDARIVWDIETALLCLPRHRLQRQDTETVAEDDGFDCGKAVKGGGTERYVDQKIEGVELDWPSEMTLILRGDTPDMLDVLMLFDPEKTKLEIGGVQIVPETILRLSRSVLDATGGLGLSGDLVLGQPAEHGTLKLLREGRYETREKPFFRSNALLVDSGTFALGDAVSIEAARNDKPLSSYAFLTLAERGTDGAPNLRVIVTSPESFSRLRLARARAKPSYIEPNWSQRIANDPLAIGLATLMSLVATFFGVLNNLFRR